MHHSLTPGPAHRASRRDALRLIAAGGAWAAFGPAAACAGESPAPGSFGAAPRLPREFRGVWVASVDNIDWPSTPRLSGDDQRAEIRRIVAECSRLGLNAILLQIRPTSDALYASPTEPWSAFLTGASGSPPRPEYDPLEVWLEETHAAGLDLHAWINPFRVRHPKSIGADAANHVSKTRPDLVRRVGPYLWLDPGEPAAREYALSVIEDVLRRYPVDGLHCDDYFYPYPQKNVPFPDDAAFARYGAGLERGAWRRNNIDTFVQATRALVRAHRPGALFTVSPFGIWRPEHPKGVIGFDAYEGLHADSRRWLREGWVDALMPQLYWPIDSPGQPFEPLLDWWRQQNPRGRHLWPGLYLTRIKPRGEVPSWEPTEIVRQIEMLRTKRGSDGFALFSMVGLLEDRRGIAGRLRALCDEPAFCPESPWAGGARPKRPNGKVDATGRQLGLAAPPGMRGTRQAETVRRWAVRVETDAGWSVRSSPVGERVIGLPANTRAVIVNAIGPNGMASADLRLG